MKYSTGDLAVSEFIMDTIVGNGLRGYSGDGNKATDATMNEPFHIDLDATEKHLYIADCFNYCIRKVDLENNIISTIGGNGLQGYSGDGSQAINATLEEPYAIQIDQNGDVYFAQRFSPAIRKIDSSSGIITTVAGDGVKGNRGDGDMAINARFIEPNDCVFDNTGGLLVADIQDQRIRRIDLSNGKINTIAGNGKLEHSGDGGPAKNASIHGARAITVDNDGNIFICEREGNSIRKIETNGIISTVAGTGVSGYSGDGGLAINATFRGPKAIRCNQNGDLLIVDTENHAIRIISSRTNIIETIAGGSKGGNGDGGIATAAGLDRPHGAISDSQGNVIIADSNNHRIRIAKLK